MMKYISFSLLRTVFLGLIFQVSFAPAEDVSNDIIKLSETTYRIGASFLNMKTGTVTVPGRVNMDRGQIELFACGPRGKLHESVLVLDIEPEHLQVALIMLGLKPGGGLAFQGDPGTPAGDSLFIHVFWEDGDGNHTRMRAEDLIYNIVKKKPMTPTPWVFSGSRFVGGKFMAGIEQSYITTFHDPFTIIDNPLATGGDDTFYEVNTAVVPPVGTPVTVELMKYRQ